MAGLKTIQDTLHQLFRGEIKVEEAAATLGVKRPERLALYRNFIRHHIRDVLGKIYVTAKGILPPDTWKILDDDFFASVPSHHWELNENVKGFVDFIHERFEKGDLEDLTAFHVELCHLEWEEFATYMDKERIPEPDTITAPTLNPTLNILQTHYPLFNFILDYRADKFNPDDPLPELLPEPQTLFLYQDPLSLKLRYRLATPELLFAIKVAHDKFTVSDAAAASGHPEELIQNILESAAEWGVVLLPKT